MTSLLTKLQSAKEGSRELDVEIYRACGFKVYPQDEPSRDTAGDAPHLTTSLDAIVSLIERVKPGAQWDLNNFECRAALSVRGAFYDYTAIAPTPALALCISLLRAMGE